MIWMGANSAPSSVKLLNHLSEDKYSLLSPLII